MKRILCSLAVVACALLVAVGSAAAAKPGGKGSQTVTATCTVLGSVTVHASNGASAWVNGTHYVLVRFTGTFTPVSGPSETFTKVYGKKKGFGPTYTCTGSQSDSSGTFTFTAIVAKTPTH